MSNSARRSSSDLHRSPLTRKITDSPATTPATHVFPPKRRKLTDSDDTPLRNCSIGPFAIDGDAQETLSPLERMDYGEMQHDNDDTHGEDEHAAENSEESLSHAPLYPLQSLSCDTVISGSPAEMIVCASWCDHADLLAIVTKTPAKPSACDEALAVADAEQDHRVSTAGLGLTAAGCRALAEDPHAIGKTTEVSTLTAPSQRTETSYSSSSATGVVADQAMEEIDPSAELTEEQYAALAAQWGDYVDPFASDDDEEEAAPAAVVSKGSLKTRTGAGLKVSDKEDQYHLTIRTGFGKILFRVEIPAIGGDSDDGTGSGWYGCNPIAPESLPISPDFIPEFSEDLSLAWPRAADLSGGRAMMDVLRGSDVAIGTDEPSQIAGRDLVNGNGNGAITREVTAGETPLQERAALASALRWMQRGGAVHTRRGYLRAGYGAVDNINNDVDSFYDVVSSVRGDGLEDGALVKIAGVSSIKTAMKATDKGAVHIHALIPEFRAPSENSGSSEIPSSDIHSSGTNSIESSENMLLIPQLHHPTALFQLPLVTALAWHPHAPYVALGLRTGAVLVFSVAAAVPVPVRGVPGLASWSQACEGAVRALSWSVVRTDAQNAGSAILTSSDMDVFAPSPLPAPLLAMNTASDAAQKARMVQTSFRTNFPEQLLGNPYHQSLSDVRATDGSLRGFTVLCAAEISQLTFEPYQNYTPSAQEASSHDSATTTASNTESSAAESATSASPTANETHNTNATADFEFDPSAELTEEQHAALAAQWGDYVDPFASDDDEEAPQSSASANSTAEVTATDKDGLCDSAPMATSAVVVRLLAHGWASIGAIHVPQATLLASSSLNTADYNTDDAAEDTRGNVAVTTSLRGQAVPLSVSLHLSAAADELTVLLGPPTSHNTSYATPSLSAKPTDTTALSVSSSTTSASISALSSASSLALHRTLYAELHYRLPRDYLKTQARFAYCVSGVEQALYLLYRHTQAAHARWLAAHGAITRKWGFVRDDILEYYNNTKAVTMDDVMMVGSDQAAVSEEDEEAAATSAAAHLNVSYVPAETPAVLEDSAYDAFGLFGGDESEVEEGNLMQVDDEKIGSEASDVAMNDVGHDQFSSDDVNRTMSATSSDLNTTRTRASKTPSKQAQAKSTPTCICGSPTCLETSQTTDPDKFWVLRRELLAAIAAGPTHPVLATFFQQYNEVKAMERLMEGVEGCLQEMLDSIGRRAIPMLDRLAWWVAEAAKADASAVASATASQSEKQGRSPSSSSTSAPSSSSSGNNSSMLVSLHYFLDSYWAFIRSVFFARYATQQFLAFWKAYALMYQAPEQTDPTSYDAKGTRLLGLFEPRIASAWVCNYLDSDGGLMGAWFKKLAAPSSKAVAATTSAASGKGNPANGTGSADLRTAETLTPASGCMHACPLALGAAYLLHRDRSRAAAMENDAYQYTCLSWEWAEAEEGAEAEGRVVGVDRLRAAGLAGLDEAYHADALITGLCARAQGKERYGSIPTGYSFPENRLPSSFLGNFTSFSSALNFPNMQSDESPKLEMTQTGSIDYNQLPPVLRQVMQPQCIYSILEQFATTVRARMCIRDAMSTRELIQHSLQECIEDAGRMTEASCRGESAESNVRDNADLRIQSRVGKYAMPYTSWRFDAAVPLHSVETLCNETCVEASAVTAEVVPAVAADRITLASSVDIGHIIRYAHGYPQSKDEADVHVDEDIVNIAGTDAESAANQDLESNVDEASTARDTISDIDSDDDADDTIYNLYHTETTSTSTPPASSSPRSPASSTPTTTLEPPSTIPTPPSSLDALLTAAMPAATATVCALTSTSAALTLSARVTMGDARGYWLCTLLLDFAPAMLNSSVDGEIDADSSVDTSTPRMATVLGLSLAANGSIVALLRHCSCKHSCLGLCPTPTHTETRVVNITPYLAEGFEPYWRVSFVADNTHALSTLLRNNSSSSLDNSSLDASADSEKRVVSGDGLTLALATTMPTVFPRVSVATAAATDARTLAIHPVRAPGGSLCEQMTSLDAVGEGVMAIATPAAVTDAICTGASVLNITRSVTAAALAARDKEKLSLLQTQISNGLIPLLMTACPPRGRALIHTGHHFLYTRGQLLLGKSLANRHMFEYIWSRVRGNRTDLLPRDGVAETQVMAFVGVEGNGIDVLIKDNVSGGYSSVVVDLDA